MSDEPAPQLRIKTAWLIGTLAAFALFAVIAAYSSRMTWDYSDYDQDRAAQRSVTLKKVQDAEQALLTPVDPKDPQRHPTAEWVDQAKGLVRIPIEEAMGEEINILKSQPVAMGVEIPPAAPPAPAKTAPASTNAAPATPATGAPASTNAAPATGAPASTNAAPATPAEGAPASTNATPATGAPASTNATPAEGAPASTNAAPAKPNK